MHSLLEEAPVDVPVGIRLPPTMVVAEEVPVVLQRPC